MPRSPRIQFEDATYHVMARGNNRKRIVFNDSDREVFVKTLGEAATKAGFEVFAWVLMDNHYHAILRTPHANLVEGMRWFQTTFTRRINTRNRLWGHLFGGRYRSILIENEDYGGAVWRDYLRAAIDYVHLNPGRAGLVNGAEKTCADYPWSSLANTYKKAPSKRPSWMAATEVLDLFQHKDTVAGRRKFLERLDSWIRSENGVPEIDGISVRDRVARGWYWGAEQFRESMFEMYDQSKSAKEGGMNRVLQSSALVKDHSTRSAEAILKAACVHFEVSREDLKVPVRRDYTRAAIADRIHRETTIAQRWLAEELGMRSAANVSRQIQVFRSIKNEDLPKPVREWIRI